MLKKIFLCLTLLNCLGINAQQHIDGDSISYDELKEQYLYAFNNEMYYSAAEVLERIKNTIGLKEKDFFLLSSIYLIIDEHEKNTSLYDDWKKEYGGHETEFSPFMYMLYGNSLKQLGKERAAILPLEHALMQFKTRGDLERVSSVYSLLYKCYCIIGKMISAQKAIDSAIEYRLDFLGVIIDDVKNNNVKDNNLGELFFLKSVGNPNRQTDFKCDYYFMALSAECGYKESLDFFRSLGMKYKKVLKKKSIDGR